MADNTTAPPEEATPKDIGTFVTCQPVGYLEPPADVVKKVHAHLKTLTDAIPAQMLRDLLVLKLLVPEESRDLVIYNLPMAAEFLGRLRHQLVLKYYQEGAKR